MLGAAPYSAGFWVAHALDITGVFTGLGAALIVYRRNRSVDEIFSSVLTVDPLVALEIGLEPVVREFVQDLDAKDRLTRDHVVRPQNSASALRELPAPARTESVSV